MPEPPIPAAFISYCRDDQDFALRLAQDLKAAGAAVWLDQLDIKPGSSWDNAVEDALLAATQMLVILTPTSVKSENVRDEISYALKQGKTVIPVLYMECTIPLRLERKQHIDFRADYARGLATLLDQLHVDEPDQTVLDQAAEAEPPRDVNPVPHLRNGPIVAKVGEPPREQEPEPLQSPNPNLTVDTRNASAQPASSKRTLWLVLAAASASLLVMAFAFLYKSPASEIDKTPPSASASTSVMPLQGYETYTNGRFGFRINYPESFSKQTPPSNGDGLTLHSQDGKAILSAFGMNSSGESVQDRYQAAIRSIHGTLGYNTTGKNWFVVTSTDGATNVYTKEFVGAASINAFTITFPADQSQYDGIITVIEKSFKPGATQLSH